jgi:hypothetical protein
MTLLESALRWHNRNVSVVPTYYRSKRPHSEALISSGLVKSNGKAAWSPLKERLPTITELIQWDYTAKRYNLAIVTTDRFIVIDFDNPQNYALWYCWQLEHNPAVVETMTVQTRRGLHLYYRLENPLDEPIKALEPFEIKSHSRLITVPPSVHPSGVEYKQISKEDKILTVKDISSLLTFSPVQFKRTAVKNNDPWIIQKAAPDKRVDLLELFPEARPTNDEGYYLTDCPFHGHRNNFMLNINDNVCHCFAGCGTFLATELYQLLTD